MASNIRLDISVPVSAATVNGWLRLAPGLRPESIQRIGSYIHGISCVLSGRIAVSTAAVAASATATFSTVIAGNSVTIGGVTFTGSDTPTTGVQFLTGSTDTASATSLAAKMNANTTVNKLIIATSSGAVVTMTALSGGPQGNFITLTKVGTPITVTGSGFLAGGSADAPVTVYNGF